MIHPEPLVMVADNEAGVLRSIKTELIRRGFRVASVTDARELVRTAVSKRPDVLIIGMTLARVSSMDVFRRLREHTTAPIIALVPKAPVDARRRTQAKRAGVDEFLEKPVDPGELTARVRAALRRPSSWSGERVVHAGAIEVDLHRRFAAKGGRIVPLTRTEWLLLSYLAEHAGHPSGSDLLQHVWGATNEHDRQNLRVWISRLRRKLEDVPSDPQVIITVPHAGYMLAVA